MKFKEVENLTTTPEVKNAFLHLLINLHETPSIDAHAT